MNKSVFWSVSTLGRRPGGEFVVCKTYKLSYISQSSATQRGGRARISKYRETGLYDLSEILGIQISPPRHEVYLCEVFSETFGEGATIQAPIH